MKAILSRLNVPMFQLRNFVTPFQKATVRKCIERMCENKVHCMVHFSDEVP